MSEIAACGKILPTKLLNKKMHGSFCRIWFASALSVIDKVTKRLANICQGSSLSVADA